MGKLNAGIKFEHILYEKRDWEARITINRPEVYNAFSSLTLEEMAQALRAASNDDEVAVVVLTGAGEKAFCTGRNAKEYMADYPVGPTDFWKFLGYLEEVMTLLRNLGKPSIARLNGVTAGGGNELHLACDLAVAADHVRLSVPEVVVGSVPAAGPSQWLPLMIGERRARALLYTGDMIDAKTAYQWGLLNEVVPYAELDGAVDRWVKKLVDKFPECLRVAQSHANFWKDLSWHLTFPHNRNWATMHYNSPEMYEGLGSFVEKRPTDHVKFRRLAARGIPSEFPRGGLTKTCGACGATALPARAKYCSDCGKSL
jgi:enoyl-CoA hydratase/carnithine racemase